MTHTFLDVYDYHRFHFPVSGTIKEVRMIEGDTALGALLLGNPPQNPMCSMLPFPAGK